jgi:hypothetical protein
MARLIEFFSLQALPVLSFNAPDNHKRDLNQTQIG